MALWLILIQLIAGAFYLAQIQNLRTTINISGGVRAEHFQVR